MRKLLKNPLIIGGVGLVALLLVLASLGWAHLKLEASLNLLWLVLAFGAFAHWLAPGERTCHIHGSGLFCLVLALSLLFPMVSANDDFMQLDLMNDAQSSQSTAPSLKADKQQTGSAGLPGPSAWRAAKVLADFATREIVSELSPAVFISIPGDATGNHSPPQLPH